VQVPRTPPVVKPTEGLEGTKPRAVLLRSELGSVLRDSRQRQGRTLRDVSQTARVSLGYLSEVERGQKEASSELLASICEALDIPLCEALREVVERIALLEVGTIPDSVPADFAASTELVDAI